MDKQHLMVPIATIAAESGNWRWPVPHSSREHLVVVGDVLDVTASLADLRQAALEMSQRRDNRRTFLLLNSDDCDLSNDYSSMRDGNDGDLERTWDLEDAIRCLERIHKHYRERTIDVNVNEPE